MMISHTPGNSQPQSCQSGAASQSTPRVDRNRLSPAMHDLLARGIVTEGWLARQGKVTLVCLKSDDMCALIAEGCLAPADIEERIPIRALLALRSHAVLRELLRENVLHPKLLTELGNRTIKTLSGKPARDLLADPIVRQQLQSGDLTLYQFLEALPLDLPRFIAAQIRRTGLLETLPEIFIQTTGKVFSPSRRTTFDVIRQCKPIRELIASGYMTLEQAMRLDYAEVLIIYTSPILCKLLKEEVITATELLSLRFDHFAMLRANWVRDALRAGRMAIVSGALTSCTSTDTGIWLRSRGVLNLAGKGVAPHGSQLFGSRYCTNPDVLAAVIKVLDVAACRIHRGPGLLWSLLCETTAIIFKNAFDHDYLEELLQLIVQRSPALHEAMTSEFRIHGVIHNLREMGVALSCKDNTVNMTEIRRPVDNLRAAEVRRVLDAMSVPDSIGLGIIQGYLDPLPPPADFAPPDLPQ